jgi:hypothetical protein
MCVGRWICLPAGALRARPAMCGALGRANVNSDARTNGAQSSIPLLRAMHHNASRLNSFSEEILRIEDEADELHAHLGANVKAPKQYLRSQPSRHRHLFDA